MVITVYGACQETGLAAYVQERCRAKASGGDRTILGDSRVLVAVAALPHLRCLLLSRRDIRTVNRIWDSEPGDELTSYGDYYVQAKVRTRDHSVMTGANLYKALLESHGGSKEPTILKALEDIKDDD